MCISLYDGGDSMTRPPVEVLAEQEEKIEELEETNRNLYQKIQHLEIAHREKIEKLETTVDILTNLCDTIIPRLDALEGIEKKPYQDCATYYQSLENQVKQLVADQECLNTNTNKTLETNLLPQDMMKRLQEMEKKIFTYKELQARGIDLKKEEEE